MKFAAAIVLLLALASVASARPVRHHHWEDDHGEEEKDPNYCTGEEHSEDECPEHYECAALEEEVCPDCEKDDYGNDDCTHKEPCWKYACIEIPKYCNVTYDGKDECVTKYGEEEDLKCKRLEEKECVAKKECRYEETDKCKTYDYEEKCTDIMVCAEEEKECEPDQKVCKDRKRVQVCNHGKDCEYTDVCKEYEIVEGKCADICKGYQTERVCEKVNKRCLVYEEEEVCDDVEVCWTGKCVKVEAPKKDPKKETPKKAGYTFGK